MAELVFPPSPTAGDLFPDPALPGVSQWIWDGSRWNLVQGGDGGGGWPAQGVTDGSDAQPGEVGEFLLFTNTLRLTENTTTNGIEFLTGQIPAGDWQVVGSYHSGIAQNHSGTVSIGIFGVTAQPNFVTWGSGIVSQLGVNYWATALAGPFRINLTSPAAFNLWAATNFTPFPSTGLPCSVAITAWRMR